MMDGGPDQQVPDAAPVQDTGDAPDSEHDLEHDLGHMDPHDHVAHSLNAALDTLRERVGELDSMSVAERIAAAEQLADEVTSMDADIAAAARGDDA